MSGYLDIVFLLVLVLLIFNRLKNVLGTGGEDTKVIMIPKEQFEKVYREMTEKAEVASVDQTVDLSSLTPLEREMAKIPNFNKSLFLRGAQRAFGAILTAFSKGDCATLSKLVSRNLLQKMERIVNERKEQGVVSETDLINFVETDVEAVNFVADDKVNVVVKFVSEQVNLLKDAQGEVLEGDENYVQKISDIWTFEKSLNPKINNWVLCSTKKC
jgi:predicted lipid-binding transport protein (Tim44 family)